MNRTAKLLHEADAILRTAILSARGSVGVRRRMIRKVVDAQRELDDARHFAGQLYPNRKR